MTGFPMIHQLITLLLILAVSLPLAYSEETPPPPRRRAANHHPVNFYASSSRGGKRALRGQKAVVDSSSPRRGGGEDRRDAEASSASKRKGVGFISPSQKRGRAQVQKGKPKNGDSNNNNNNNKPIKADKRQGAGGPYNHHNSRAFVEACEQELIADVINGGVIQHKQYVGFIYDYCLRETKALAAAAVAAGRASGRDATGTTTSTTIAVVNKGHSCNRDGENKGFDGLSNDLKLMYIKSFCPQDVNGQVSCLHGMNDRGRQIQFDNELEGLCLDLETLMFKNELLEEGPTVKVPNGNGDFFSTTQPQLGVRPGSDSVSTINNRDHNKDTVSGYETISDYVNSGGNVGGPAGGGKNDFTFVGQDNKQDSGQQTSGSPPKVVSPAPPTPRPTRRPTMTRRPTPWPTPAPKHAGGKNNPKQSSSTPPPLAPPPWERPTNSGYSPSGGSGILQAQDSDSSQSHTLHPAFAPTRKPLDLIVLDADGNEVINDTTDLPLSSSSNKKNDDEGMTGGTVVAIILIAALGMTIAFSTLLLIRKWRRTKSSGRQRGDGNGGGRFLPPTPGIFFMNMRKVKPMDNINVTTRSEVETYRTNGDKTYDETDIDDRGEDNSQEDELDQRGSGRHHHNSNNSKGDSIGSEEIDFHGPLFDSWPAVAPASPNSADDGNRMIDTSSPRPNYTGGEEDSAFQTPMNGGNDILETGSELDSTPGLRTFTSSLLSSFFSRAKKGEEDVPSTENAIDEIKRAIDDAQWQEVYYLASKMAAQGNIDSNENLQSALVRSSNDQGGGNFAAASGTSPKAAPRKHLKPEDEQRAAQLDVSLQVGDWITLAARAAVFAALDSANNPVPASISFVNGQKQQSNADECLAKARAALEEAQKMQAKKMQQEQEQQQQQDSVVPEDSAISSSTSEQQHRVMFVDADDAHSEGDGEFEYPKDDYSDFTKTSTLDDMSPLSGYNISGCGFPPHPGLKVPSSSVPPEPTGVVEEVDSTTSDQEGEEDDEDYEDNGDEGTQSSARTRDSVPGPPSIAMSNQSTIPTKASAAGTPQHPFATIEETARGPFQRDFKHGTLLRLSMMNQDEEEEMEGMPGQSL